MSVTTLADRFWVCADRSGGPERCWPWTRHIANTGYGKFGIRWAHRVAWELTRGLIPDGLVIDHLCRVRRCVNPAHMEVVTHRENILRGTGMSARMARQTECQRGHPFTEDNTYLTPNRGTRQCRTCIRIRSQRLTDKRRQGIADLRALGVKVDVIR